MIHLYRTTQYPEWYSHSDYCYCVRKDGKIKFDKDIDYIWIDTEIAVRLIKIPNEKKEELVN